MRTSGKAVDPAARLQFGRIVDEFVRWREVPADDRSPAPAWWWGPAFEMQNMQTPMPDQWCIKLGVAEGSTCADGARVFLESLSDQTSLPWPGDFPRRSKDSTG